MTKLIKDKRYKTVVTILKIKKDIPTVIEVAGRKYILEHKDQYRGGNHDK